MYFWLQMIKKHNEAFYPYNIHFYPDKTNYHIPIMLCIICI